LEEDDDAEDVRPTIILKAPPSSSTPQEAAIAQVAEERKITIHEDD
jgi:hypothetical protein